MIDEKQIKKWSENARNDRLYIAILTNDIDGTERLKDQGVGLSGYVRNMLITGGGGGGKCVSDWHKFCYGVSASAPEEFVRIIRSLHDELGGSLCYSSIISKCLEETLFQTEVFRCVIDCFDRSRINKKRTLMQIIENNRAELLGTAAEQGWIRFARDCDMYIEYANQNGSTECAAFLLDFKNRAFDPVLEREKEEKRRNAEFNAAPDSILIMKKLWRFEKHWDGSSVKIRGYKGSGTEIVVPGKIGGVPVTSLELAYSRYRTFADLSVTRNVTKITLPEGLISIGSNVFENFTGLTEINIPEGVVSIGREAFSNCINLNSIVLPDSLKEIGEDAFFRCSALEEINIPMGTEIIEKAAFQWCRNLESVTIPDSVTKIETAAFQDCKKLTHIRLPDTIGYIGERAFYCCESLEEIVIPEGAERIEYYAFGECLSLTRLVIPGSVRLIATGAFARCGKLESVILPDGVISIGHRAFSECTSLKEIVLPNSITAIGDSAFSECTSLKEIVLPESILRIGNDVFAECPAIERIVLPSAVKNITSENYTSFYSILKQLKATVFDKSDKAAAVVTRGSYAEEFCRTNFIPFVYN